MLLQKKWWVNNGVYAKIFRVADRKYSLERVVI